MCQLGRNSSVRPGIFWCFLAFPKTARSRELETKRAACQPDHLLERKRSQFSGIKPSSARDNR